MHFEWKTEYEIGHKVIDAQHRRLIEIVNQLEDAVAGGKRRSQLIAIIDQLERYVEVHFNMEEHKMRESGYPGLDEHMREHRAFTQKLVSFSLPIRQGKSWPAATMLRWLIDWIGNHITIQDQRYAPWIAGREPEPPQD